MSEKNNIAIAFFSEIIAFDARLKVRISEALPFRMELSHFMILNHLAGAKRERAPIELAKAFNLTKGAITNTLQKLEKQGYVHVRPDWDDGRRKWVLISEAGLDARDLALRALEPLYDEVFEEIGFEGAKDLVRSLRQLRQALH